MGKVLFTHFPTGIADREDKEMNIDERLCGKWERINEETGQKVGCVVFDRYCNVKIRSYIGKVKADGFYYILSEESVVMYFGTIFFDVAMSISGDTLTIGSKAYVQTKYKKCSSSVLHERMALFVYISLFFNGLIVISIIIAFVRNLIHFG